MKTIFFAIAFLVSLSASAVTPMKCTVSLVQGEGVRDFVMTKTERSTSFQYGITDLEGKSFYANQAKDDDSVNLIIQENGKTHLSNAPAPQPGKMDCLTIDFGNNATGEDVKVAISCEAD